MGHGTGAPGNPPPDLPSPAGGTPAADGWLVVLDPGGVPVDPPGRVPSGYDLALCRGRGCPIRALCLRHLAESVGRQEWLATEPWEHGACPKYLDARPEFRRALHRAAIEREAYEVYEAGRGATDLAWLLAEARLAVEALVSARLDIVTGRVAVPCPMRSAQETLASRLWGQRPATVTEWHWLLAEERLLARSLAGRLVGLAR